MLGSVKSNQERRSATSSTNSAEALHRDRTVKAVLSGVSNPVITGDALDAPLSYEGLDGAGAGLGSAGFIVFDDSRNMLSVVRMVSRFLYVESCGQCRACKYGTGEIQAGRLDALAEQRAQLQHRDHLGTPPRRH